MKWIPRIVFVLVFLAVSTVLWNKKHRTLSTTAPAATQTLAEARRGFVTKLVRREGEHEGAPMPPAGVFRYVNYRSPAGELVAYVTPSPGDGKKHPAIIWIVGGFSNSIWDIAWTPGPPQNDQSATPFGRA